MKPLTANRGCRLRWPNLNLIRPIHTRGLLREHVLGSFSTCQYTRYPGFQRMFFFVEILIVGGEALPREKLFSSHPSLISSKHEFQRLEIYVARLGKRSCFSSLCRETKSIQLERKEYIAFKSH